MHKSKHMLNTFKTKKNLNGVYRDENTKIVIKYIDKYNDKLFAAF